MISTKEILKKYIDAIYDKKQEDQKISFFILNGESETGKSKLTQDLAKDVLGDFISNDFLYVKDLSAQLKKQHTIKVAEKVDERYKTLLNEYDYKDIGTREINSWLYKSPAGNMKIVLIENIERMGSSAINAFLKNCEEPLPNRIIIATTSNKSQILDTVMSRAIVIESKTDNKHINVVGGDTLESELKSVINVLSTEANIYKKHKILSDINKKGLILPFIDKLISYYISNNDFQNTDRRLKFKKMSLTNVNTDNLLFYCLLD